jgi:myosin heavy subunit
MKFTSDEENAIWSIVASCLHIGNINFDDSTFDNDKPCAIKNSEHLQTIATLLKVDYERLTKSILFKIREMGKSIKKTILSKLSFVFDLRHNRITNDKARL